MSFFSLGSFLVKVDSRSFPNDRDITRATEAVRLGVHHEKLLGPFVNSSLVPPQDLYLDSRTECTSSIMIVNELFQTKNLSHFKQQRLSTKY